MSIRGAGEGDVMWRQFTPAWQHADSTVVTRAEGCYFWDASGRRYLDALAGLHSVNIGFGPWPELVGAATGQLEALPFFPNWFGFSNAPAVALASKLAELAPIDVGHVFFVQSGSEAVEAAMKLARQYHRLRGEPDRVKFVSRHGAYHGTTLGALSLNGAAALRDPFEPLLDGTVRFAPPYPYRCHSCSTRGCTLACADELDAAIRAEGPETVAAVVLEPAQNSGGALVPPPGYAQRVRRICDEHGVLLVVDETICAFGRVGEWFGSTRYGFEPDVMTLAKALTSSWAPLGAMVSSAEVSEPFFNAPGRTFLHGSTFGGHPVSCAIALANIGLIEREGLLARVARHGPGFRARLEEVAARHPLVGEVRGDGYLLALELVKDRDRRIGFGAAERARLISEVLMPGVRRRGLHMKFDDRLELAALLTPALVAGPDEFERMVVKLEAVLDQANPRRGRSYGPGDKGRR